MKKTLLIALSAAFLASPLIACDGMMGHEKTDLKASASPARKAKMAKLSKAKAAKPVAEAPSSEKKI